MKKIMLLLCSALVGIGSHAQERPFARTFATNILHPGHVAVELLHTSKFGHENNNAFHAMDQYLEFEVGVSHRLQAAFSMTRFQQTEENLDDPLHKNAEVGVLTEWKWRINHPEKKTGFGMFGAFGFRGSEIGFEPRLLVDHKFGHNLLAFNLTSEFEFETHKEEGEHSIRKRLPVQLDLAYMHHFSHSFGAGLEVIDCNDFGEGSWNNSILFAGPTVSYWKEHWFVVANYLPQLVNLHTTRYYPDKKVLTDHEKSEARIILGFIF